MTYFDLDDLRALPDMGPGADRFSDQRLQEAHDWIVAIIERECQTSFVLRSVVGERTSGDGSGSLALSAPYVSLVVSATVDGVPLTQPVVDALWVRDGYLDRTDGTAWGAGAGNVLVTYLAGYSDEPPADLKQAALRGARNWLLTMDQWSGADSRSTSISNEFGNMTLATANANGMPTGIPDVDATITKWARRVRVPKVR